MINPYGLSLATMQRECPALFAEQPHTSRSDKYLFIPTLTLLETLDKAGFVPVEVMQAAARSEDRVGYTKHFVRLRQRSLLGMHTALDIVPEVVIVNSHGGESSYVVKLGYFRFICRNGLIVGDTKFTLTVAHRGNVLQNVVDSTCRVIEESEGALERINQMKQIELTRPEQLLLAQRSMQARFGDKPVVYQPEDFLFLRQPEEKPNTLYITFNTLQQNLLTPNKTYFRRRYEWRNTGHTPRKITSIDGTVQLNEALWRLAEDMVVSKTR